MAHRDRQTGEKEASPTHDQERSPYRTPRAFERGSGEAAEQPPRPQSRTNQRNPPRFAAGRLEPFEDFEGADRFERGLLA